MLKMLPRALVCAALVLLVTSALPLRAARGPILSSCLPWRGCPKEGGDLGLTGFSEAIAMYDDDESGSASAWTGKNGLDRAASKVFATSVAATMARLQLNQNDAANGGVDEEEAAQGYLGRALVKLLAISLEIVVGLFVFGRVIPRCSSSKGTAWRSSVVGYLLIWGDVAHVAAETSVRGRSDYTNESPSSSVQSLGQRRELSGYVMTDSNIKTAVAAWLADATAAESTYGHISTWDVSGVTDMEYLFCAASGNSDCNTSAASFNEDIGAWDTSGVTSMRSMFQEASAFNQDLGWCLDTASDLAFTNTLCESTSCGVVQSMICDYPMTDSNIRTAVAAWRSDSALGSSTYGYISTWDTSGVTDMSDLFNSDDNSAWYGASWNEEITHIGRWDTSGVTNMNHMFYGASAFNQDIGGWVVDSVRDMGDRQRRKVGHGKHVQRCLGL